MCDHDDKLINEERRINEGNKQRKERKGKEGKKRRSRLSIFQITKDGMVQQQQEKGRGENRKIKHLTKTPQKVPFSLISKPSYVIPKFRKHHT